MTAYEMGKYWTLHALETYRDAPPDAPERAFIDRLIDRSRRAVGDDPLEKKYHNLIVLRYITGTRPSVQRICEALHMSRAKKPFEAETERAVDRLLVLAFGVNGLNWACSASRPGETPGLASTAPERGKPE